MNKEIILRILLDSDNDNFKMNLDSKGFDEKTPLQNSLVIASILRIVSNQELDKFKE